ncbi:MAG TPA: hypothetical protein GX708_09615 [Gallicola sp.]|nr:hypothetical protein [Gallicola sp.]
MNISRENKISKINNERTILERALKKLIIDIGPIPIANTRIMPYGWRKAAKGRTVWRIIEEIISQNLEYNQKELGFKEVKPSKSEVGVFDFKFTSHDGIESFVNIKSSVLGGKRNKDDISKANGILDFFAENNDANLFIASFIIDFKSNMTIEIVDCIVFPIAWIPDIYINPSNNGNMQSAYYKNIEMAVQRTNDEFLELFMEEFEIAKEKRIRRLKK